MNWTETLEQQAALAYKAARGVIGAVDEAEVDWRPETGHNWMNIGQLMRHISIACGNTAQAFVTGDWMGEDHGVDPEWKPGEGEMMPAADAYLSYSKGDALAALDKDHELFLAMVREAGEQRLAGELSKAPWGQEELNLGQHFLSCIAHLDTHKAQLFYYLKLQGKPVHTGILWGTMTL